MFLTRLKIATVLLLVASVFGAGAIALIHPTLAAEPNGPKEPSGRPAGGPGQDQPPGQSKVSSPQQPIEPDADRAAAEWVLSVGGRIQTAAGYFEKKDPLGDGPFKITAIRLASTDKVQDDDLARFKDLTTLNNLFLAETPVGDAGLKHVA